MAAGVKNVFVCPRCEEGITAEKRPAKCPSCKFDFSAGVRGYVPPITYAEQLEKLQDPRGHTEALLGIDINKMNDMLNDALNIVETLPAKKVKVSDIRTAVGLAIRIGKIAEAYHKFLEEGGKHTPSLLLPSGGSNELPKKSDGGDSTGDVSIPVQASLEKTT